MSPTAGRRTFYVNGIRRPESKGTFSILRRVFNEFTYSIRLIIVYKLTIFYFCSLIIPRECQRNWIRETLYSVGWLFVQRNQEWFPLMRPRVASWSQYDIRVYFKSTFTPTASEFWPIRPHQPIVTFDIIWRFLLIHKLVLGVRTRTEKQILFRHMNVGIVPHLQIVTSLSIFGWLL